MYGSVEAEPCPSANEQRQMNNDVLCASTRSRETPSLTALCRDCSCRAEESEPGG